jgi:hypothetical protein
MIYTLDKESKKRIEDLADLQDHVSAIHASVQTVTFRKGVTP